MKIESKPKIIIIVGPTAVGKSDLAVQIAKKFNGEIISADSRQVYKDMNLGTGKITKKEMLGIPHYLLDVVSPIRSNFNVKKFQQKAYKKIDEILKKNKTPIIVGGTGFYIQSIVDGIVLPEIKLNPDFRKKLEKLSLVELQKKLAKADPDRFTNIDIKNKVRLIRALEIVSEFGSVPKYEKNPKYNPIQIGLKLDQEKLKEKIVIRLDKRLKKGMLAEAKKLHKSGLSWKKMESFGLEYKFMALYLQNKISLEEMKNEIINKSCQYAKRQITWFKKDQRIKWFSPKDQPSNTLRKIISDFL